MSRHRPVIKNTSPENLGLCISHGYWLRRSPTAAERRVKYLLYDAGVYFRFQKGFCNAVSHYIVDFYFPKPEYLCLEVDGPYHNTPEQKLKDMLRDRWFVQERRFRVVRITNQQAMAMTARELLAVLQLKSY